MSVDDVLYRWLKAYEGGEITLAYGRLRFRNRVTSFETYLNGCSIISIADKINTLDKKALHS